MRDNIKKYIMKKLFFLLIAANGVLSATAQMNDSTAKKQFHTDAELQHWVVDVNLLGGILTQDLTTANSTGNYLNALSDANYGKLKFTNGTSFGFDAQLGYFFGNSNHFGVGAGIMYLSQMGDATLDQFHVQFQSTDGFNNTSREIITANQPIKEALNITNINIPIVLKYKDRFSKRFGITVDAGVLYNIQEKNMYKTNASFDYEEIIKNVSTTGGGNITVYDNSLVPSTSDLTITKNWFNGTSHPGETIQQYFNYEQSKGYNVGLGVTPNNKSGSVSYQTGSIGFLIQPSLNYYLSDNVALNIGGYYIMQTFNTSAMNGYHLTDKPGDYSSVLNNVTKSANQSYGLNIGVRFFFGKKAEKQAITAEDVANPTACGLTDGSITLHGLKPGKDVNVNYTINGVTNSLFTGTQVAPDGTVKIPKLGAGAYTNISAIIGKHHLDGYPVNLVNPSLNISAYSTNPSAAGVCDGTITISGLRAGEKATVNYSFNGSPKPAYTTTVSSNNTVVLTGLCGGRYGNIVIEMAGCTANGSDMVLTDPKPVVKEEPVTPKEPPLADISTPILFEVGKTKIHASSYPTLENAIEQVKKDDKFYILCEGHTDNTGTDKINDLLSFRRAEAVKRYLIKHGVSADRIVAIGRGSKMPMVPNDTPENRAKNRRVVMTLKERGK